MEWDGLYDMIHKDLDLYIPQAWGLWIILGAAYFVYL